MRKIDEYELTDNSRVYRIIRLHHVELSCCLKCKRRQTRKWYYKHSKNDNRFPNWKLVSKNKKQWMPKDLKIEDDKWATIEW